MDKFLSGLGNSQINAQQFTTKLSTGNSMPVQLLDMKPGDIFQGEIVAVNGNEVQLKLAANQLLAARLEGQVQLALGQLLSFQVQSNKDAHIVLKPVYTNLLQQQVGVAALKAASLPVTDKSMDIVSELLENGMPIDKNSLSNAYRQILLHPDSAVKTVMNLIKLNLPVTDTNVAQYEAYKNMEHKLLDGINDTVSDIFKTYDSLPEKEGIEFIGKVLEFLDSSKENEVISESKTQQKVEVSDNAKLPEPDVPKTDTQEIKAQDIKPQDIKTIPENVSKTDDIKNDINVNNNEQIFSGDKSYKFQHTNNKNELQNLLNGLSDGEKTQLIRSDSFRTVVKNRLVDIWTMTPEDVKEPEKIQQFYKKLSHESENLVRIIQETSPNTTATQNQSAQNIHDNVEFMNQMNHVFQYVQLPLKLSQSNAQGELYVFTNKRNLAKKEGNLTALLHLDMENLGKMDINIDLHLDSNTVTTRFYLQDDVTLFLEEHMEELTSKLVAKGYRTKSSVSRMNEEKSVVDLMDEQISGKIAPLSYQAFDMRT